MQRIPPSFNQSLMIALSGQVLTATELSQVLHSSVLMTHALSCLISNISEHTSAHAPQPVHFP